MNVNFQTITPYNIYSILKSPDVPTDVKRIIAQQNKEQILSDVCGKLTGAEYKKLLETRYLEKGRPIKNSLIKRADMYILSDVLGIKKSELTKYVGNIVENNFQPIGTMSKQDVELTKQYIYRHGKKDDVLKLLKYELSDVKHTLGYLYRTLESNSGGLYDYFERPIHLLDNKTAKKMHTIMTSSLDNAKKAGYISEDENISAADFALKRIYDIQSNYKVLKAAQIVRYEG